MFYEESDNEQRWMLVNRHRKNRAKPNRHNVWSRGNFNTRPPMDNETVHHWSGGTNTLGITTRDSKVMNGATTSRTKMPPQNSATVAWGLQEWCKCQRWVFQNRPRHRVQTEGSNLTQSTQVVLCPCTTMAPRSCSFWIRTVQPRPKRLAEPI